MWFQAVVMRLLNIATIVLLVFLFLFPLTCLCETLSAWAGFRKVPQRSDLTFVSLLASAGTEQTNIALAFLPRRACVNFNGMAETRLLILLKIHTAALIAAALIVRLKEKALREILLIADSIDRPQKYPVISSMGR